MRNLILLMVVMLLAGCRTKYVEVPIGHTRTEYRTITQHDSIYVNDSIYTVIYEKQDTVYNTTYKYKNLYKFKYIHDTLQVTDTIPKVIKVDRQETLEQLVQQKQSNKNKLYAIAVLVALLLLSNIGRIRKILNTLK